LNENRENPWKFQQGALEADNSSFVNYPTHLDPRFNDFHEDEYSSNVVVAPGGMTEQLQIIQRTNVNQGQENWKSQLNQEGKLLEHEDSTFLWDNDDM
jgi:hypothetical protein